jgi:tetratricopeptide (TPR) repeat protein
MNRGNILLSIVTAFILTAYACPGGAQSVKPPLNLIPMYGYPDIEKPEALKKVDEDFIKAVVGTDRSREEVSKGFAGEGWRNLSNGDAANAMRRFNQSWLLNPNNYQPYWGFGALLFAQRKPSEAATHYEKALSLINEESEKPRLLSDAARAYSMQGFIATDKMKSEEFFGKANSLFAEAIKLDPQYGNAYRYWAMSLSVEGNYKMAWDIVQKSRALGGDVVSSDFIDALSKKMPEPK